MFMNSSKMIIFIFMMMSTIMMISNNSWIISWMLMEINLFSFIPLMFNKNSWSSESMMKYFFIQTISSLLLFFFIMNLWKLIDFKLISLMNLCLMMKMGASPFHLWYIQIIESMSWMNFFLISSWQKIMPLIMLSYNFNLNLIIMMIYLNSLFSFMGGINQTSMRKIMGYSSLNHISWMLSSIMMNFNMLLIYLFTYLIMMMNICMIIYMFNVNKLNQLFQINNLKLNLLMFSLIFFSLSGLPPFIGFISKWMIVNFLIMNNFIFMNLFMIISSLIVLFFYLNMMYYMILFNKYKMKWFLNFNNINLSNFMTINILIMFFFAVIMYTYMY
uniref:NADH-ubiquinone oxidoreductase chain 2 n=1 Tax=Paduniella communis TaxID=2904892 RepID=A0A9E8LQ08_9NEOP|nr:NADH dehydrogenase subunit 2 [Paduniella communis]UZZ44247.1 NADH dehydrogenase subunit 2 [Paduniella communis]